MNVNASEWAYSGPTREYFFLIACFAVSAEIADAVQRLYLHREYAPGGLYSWTCRRVSHERLSQGLIGALLAGWFSESGVLACSVLQLAFSLTAITHIKHATYLVPCLGLSAIRLGSQLRDGEFGTDGSSQMQLVLLSALIINACSVSPLAKSCALWFVGISSLTAHETSGVVKLLSPGWRNGSALRNAFCTRIFGSRALLSLVNERQRLLLSFSWAIIVFECIAPVSVLVHPWFCVAFLIAGTAFHFCVACAMGLNSFLLPFLGTYPAVLRLSLDLHRALRVVLLRH